MRTLIFNPKEWHIWFAWYPIDTINGWQAWWERVERRWNPELNVRILDPYDPGYPDGAWEYRIISHE